MGEFLFEIFSEEMPSAYQQKAAKSMYDQIIQNVKTIYVSDNIIGDYFVTPRRIGFHLEGIAEFAISPEAEVRGPKISAPEKALEGFMNKYDVRDKSLLEQQGEYYFLKQKAEQNPTEKILQDLIENMLKNFVWEKSMRWGDYDVRWIRPIHSILSIYNNKVIPIKFGHIKASNFTFGHRFMSDAKKLLIQSYSEYKDELLKHHVEISPAKRLQIILEDIDKICKEKKLRIIEDQPLLDEIVGLVEYPFIVLGKIDEKFMSLPEEVLITSLRSHQKYIMLRDTKGNLAPYFIIVSNIKPSDGFNNIIKGNEKVLSARLNDAKFFFKIDTKTKLEDKILELKKITYHTKIGSYYDKMLIVENIAIDLAKQLDVSVEKIKKCCRLAKADLVTNMVKEFPELQGVMGYHYAIFDGESEDIALAIKEHYKPQGPNDDMPTNIFGTILALSDKVATLNLMFAHGITPTGSKDPFALRRAALGIIRLICANKLTISFQQIQLREDVKKFIIERIKYINSDQNKNYDFDLKYIYDAI